MGNRNNKNSPINPPLFYMGMPKVSCYYFDRSELLIDLSQNLTKIYSLIVSYTHFYRCISTISTNEGSSFLGNYLFFCKIGGDDREQ
jgi:hypothetical protein